MNISSQNQIFNMMNKLIFYKIFFVVIFTMTELFTSSQIFAQAQHYNTKSNLAIQGYDPVSYFNNNPQKGAKSFTYAHNGVMYRFVSEINRKTFSENPGKYEPQYGGWCAYAMGKDGSKVAINPKTYKIKDGKLYLFYNAWGTNTLNYWNDDETSLKSKADVNWKKIIK